jgi:hypothetical protein
METERISITELFEQVEAFKAADPRSTSRDPHTTIALYVDISKIIRQAGWGTWEYEAALASVYV